MKNEKNYVLTIVLALFLGGIGVHRFYLGQTAAGVLMLIFFWTFIPAIIAFIDVIRYLVMGESEFHRRYSGAGTQPQVRPVGSAVEELEKLAALKEKGHITEAEFNQKKTELLK
jgi:TM2 domain-containing membrane protein YozV